ncbi:hypothetical protein K443DRAFT_1889 [Laccaria amethystina LaAM-08-1]|uniref:Unplaced genomic scaffold K443scaffold_9, whole genome shotgun sequence n=1 Tax=Laccaria amethystina LaAM-08-1 TaxID=1095629 RepID=A0A0C9XSS7_9AGAR|nr:hypothetical protein K443DRAFT_1889 [Laccaria amethystina LaAM-08-1]
MLSQLIDDSDLQEHLEHSRQSYRGRFEGYQPNMDVVELPLDHYRVFAGTDIHLRLPTTACFAVQYAAIMPLSTSRIITPNRQAVPVESNRDIKRLCVAVYEKPWGYLSKLS